MTLKIEKDSAGGKTTLRLIGRLRSRHLEELRAQMEGNGTQVVLDLEDVSLVDTAVVRFLGACESEGVRVLHCSPYIREWISREQTPG
jgi:anti-anti-sigma regulatory factor